MEVVNLNERPLTDVATYPAKDDEGRTAVGASGFERPLQRSRNAMAYGHFGSKLVIQTETLPIIERR